MPEYPNDLYMYQFTEEYLDREYGEDDDEEEDDDYAEWE